MGLISFFQRKRQAGERSHAAPVDPSQLEQLRTRARRRLIGAVVLVVSAVIGLPMLFDAKPRQLPANIAVDIARRDASAPTGQALQAPATDAPAPPLSSGPAAPPRDAAAPNAHAPAPQAAAPAAARPQEARPAAKPGAKPEGTTRFVIQVGAFEQAAAAREARARVERMGLRTFEQEVGATGAKRIRVRIGPFPSREEADRVAAKVRSHGLNATVLAL